MQLETLSIMKRRILENRFTYQVMQTFVLSASSCIFHDPSHEVFLYQNQGVFLDQNEVFALALAPKLNKVYT